MQCLGSGRFFKRCFVEQNPDVGVFGGEDEEDGEDGGEGIVDDKKD